MPRQWPLLYLTATVFVAVFHLPESEGSVLGNFTVRNCNHSFLCGEHGNLTLPFWLKSPTSPPKPLCGVDGFGSSIILGGNHFRILHVNPLGPGHRVSMTLANNAFWELACPWNSEDLTNLGDLNLLSYSETYRNLSLFHDCNDFGAAASFRPGNKFSCGDGGNDLSWVTNSGLERPDGCEDEVIVRVSGSGFDALQNLSIQWPHALKLGFDVEFDFDKVFYNKCEHDSNSVEPLIKARDSNRWKRKLAIGLGCGTFGGIAISGLVFYCYVQHKKRSSPISTLLSRRIFSAPSMATNNEIGGCFPGVHQFTYTELAQATDNFDSARSLGDGGFGTVYYGKLQDGRVVAVKRLYENNYRRVERFMNEVEIIARLRHKNLVVLYGCTSRHSRELLLVYEYVPNGTVADHLHGERAKPGGLPWPTRLKIAIETASALAYLHASDIIHRDVKTDNILLDDNFVVKVADFGLSRLFAAHVTHVSTVPQGTPGYIDPEYHQCYQLSDKSDVYSFGVVLIELISSMRAVDVNRHRHEINLAEVAINKIQGQALHELVDPSLGFESDYKLRKMIAAVAEVAFRCLQYERDMRPSIVDVLQVLKGIESEGMTDEVVLLNSGPLPHSPDSL